MATKSSGERGQCPHCLTTVKFEDSSSYHARSNGFQALSGTHGIVVHASQCPHCLNMVISLNQLEQTPSSQSGLVPVADHIVWPFATGRNPVHPDVPEVISADYREAALVLPLSPKASAALSRRCMQNVLKTVGNAPGNNLSKQIDYVLPKLPSWVSNGLHAAREIGNLSAHVSKSEHTGEIVDVSPGEAETNLDVLDALFDHYYVKPAEMKRKIEALNAKLLSAGRDPVKFEPDDGTA